MKEFILLSSVYDNSRSRKPTINKDGIPFLLNYVTRDLDSIIIKNRVIATLTLSLPKVLSEKLAKGEIETENPAQTKPIAEDWLPALLKKVKKRRSR